MKLNLIYCDYIAHIVRHALQMNDSSNLIGYVSTVKYDIGTNGEFLSTKKTLLITDSNGTDYKITIEEYNHE